MDNLYILFVSRPAVYFCYVLPKYPVIVLNKLEMEYNQLEMEDIQGKKYILATQ